MAFIKDRLKTMILKLLDDPQLEARLTALVRKVVINNAKEILESIVHDQSFPRQPKDQPQVPGR